MAFLRRTLSGFLTLSSRNACFVSMRPLTQNQPFFAFGRANPDDRITEFAQARLLRIFSHGTSCLFRAAFPQRRSGVCVCRGEAVAEWAGLPLLRSYGADWPDCGPADRAVEVLPLQEAVYGSCGERVRSL